MFDSSVEAKGKTIKPIILLKVNVNTMVLITTGHRGSVPLCLATEASDKIGGNVMYYGNTVLILDGTRDWSPFRFYRYADKEQ